MVKRTTMNRLNATTKTNWVKLLAYCVPVSLIIFLAVSLMVPGWRNHDPKKPKSEKTVAEAPQPNEYAQAFGIAEDALEALKIHLRELDRSALRFERDRAKGTYGSGDQGLLKYWQKWSDGFKKRFDATAAEYDIRFEQQLEDSPTPIHLSFQLVRKVPFEIRLCWQSDNSIEGLPIRLQVDRSIEEARKWIEDGVK